MNQNGAVDKTQIKDDANGCLLASVLINVASDSSQPLVNNLNC